MTRIAEPGVTLIAHTTVTTLDGTLDTAPHAAEWLEPQQGTAHAEYITEFAGRACYQSFNRPNPATATTADYLRRTLFEQKHWSIAEHATATFYITGVSRAFTHELIRHRHLSYSQLSQRFVDEGRADIVVPPAMRGEEDVLLELERETSHYYSTIVDVLTDDGLPRKQVREAARAALPNMTETRIVVTGNLRAWHEVIERRTAPDADAEMQEVMGMVRDQLTTIAPTIFPEEK
ncbi:FAD-dependent thymidylate synthase [Corynebacterium ureicelerivorans]|uniref:FAD-dependent thymidylate synthase n=1 Tax=Corynebacterium ureicelerivorans TaxID=401472 RepID=A0A077HLC3_9CORY|nr:FAD-dependent thymidylate synthase [Corynebacterium ureicelerivorans]AIL96414.1 thymidylate synthase [Corynebacterium ureicelerivorans]AIL97818.1 thymidylate synthase [Corynebacterium ureicelerivorans]